MNIPALFTLFRDGVPMAGNAEYSEGRLRVLSPLTPLKPLGAEFGDRGPAVVIDVKGLNGRVFD
ncbi:MAG: hypothetical protein LBT41_00240, partial [Candidatus Methanoplasma sp.]|nr:hypothetical protein [Candidatus Methanoplasma sp.]